MQFTQPQDWIIDTAHSEGQVDPGTFARLLRQDLDEVHAAISDLINRGLVAAAKGDTFRLTDQGEAVHQAREKAHSDAVKMNTRTWQPR